MAGRHFEDFEVGMVIQHETGRTITEADNVLFCALTMNNQPLHLDETYAKGTPFGQRVVNGLLTLSLSVGLSVNDLTAGTLVANLGYYDVEHTKPVFHGDTIRVRSDVVAKRPTSKPDRGLVEIRHVVTNQRGEEVLTYKRRALVRTREASKG
ncbi:MAG TPA: MaoC family dehydratase [Candidatus Thermoplasmatota archaeon]|nr:MaoC family dehydratase [Candidatus Thermoplasmatota archaeon]